MNVAALADAVRGRAPGAPLDRIGAALLVTEELTSGADELIGQFVAEARRAGCLWTEIGQRIGVSKQAARQRFAQPLVAGGAALQSKTAPDSKPRLLACLEAAGREAAADGAAEIGTHHQLIGLWLGRRPGSVHLRRVRRVVQRDPQSRGRGEPAHEAGAQPALHLQTPAATPEQMRHGQ